VRTIQEGVKLWNSKHSAKNSKLNKQFLRSVYSSTIPQIKICTHLRRINIVLKTNQSARRKNIINGVAVNKQ